MKSFIQSIRKMNETYELPCPTYPTLLPVIEAEARAAEVQPADYLRSPHEIHLKSRVEKFIRTLNAELDEGNEIDFHGQDTDSILTELSDWFGDLIVYVASESQKFGIPIEKVLEAIQRSNNTKLGEDGKPIKNADGKFMKGPNFVPPEPEIKQLIKETRLPYVGV